MRIHYSCMYKSEIKSVLKHLRAKCLEHEAVGSDVIGAVANVMNVGALFISSSPTVKVSCRRRFPAETVRKMLALCGRVSSSVVIVGAKISLGISLAARPFACADRIMTR